MYLYRVVWWRCDARTKDARTLKECDYRLMRASRDWMRVRGDEFLDYHCALPLKSITPKRITDRTARILAVAYRRLAVLIDWLRLGGLRTMLSW
jgi:hypothetical protein